MFVPEVEEGKAIKTTWIKQLSDKAQLWKGRGLFKDMQKFRIPGMLMCCSNVPVPFSGLDGGVLRRALGFEWCVSIKPHPQGPWQRRRIPGLKDGSYYTKVIKAGYLHAVMVTYCHFFANDGPGLDGWRPGALRAAIEQMFASELADHIKEWLNDSTQVETCAAKDGTTKPKFLEALRKHVSATFPRDVKESAITKALAGLVEFKKAYGNNHMVKMKSVDKYVKIKS